MIEISKNIQGLNNELFVDIINHKVFDEDLEDNLKASKSLMKRNFEVPTAYVNGHKVGIYKLERSIITALKEDM